MFNVQYWRIVFVTLCITFSGWIGAECDVLEKSPPFPVDVSFLVIDMKYNSERGVQICEIQHGVPSIFKGERFSYDGKSYIAENLIKELSRFYPKSWAEVNFIADVSVREEINKSSRWSAFKNATSLMNNTVFKRKASQPPSQPDDLSTYHGFVLMSAIKSSSREKLRNKYPGIVPIDNASYMYAKDKLKMSELLQGDPLTEQHKPKWGIYQRKYNPNLAEIINEDIGSDILVIKPLGEYKGTGVLIINKEDLPQALEGILQKVPNQSLLDDPAYQYWLTSDASSFIVEEFIDSDPIVVPHLDNKVYSPTLRLAFLLYYNKGTVDIVCLGGYCSLPKKALSEEGTLNEKYKSCCELPYYCKPDPEMRINSEAQLKEVLYIVYKKMLGIY